MMASATIATLTGLAMLYAAWRDWFASSRLISAIGWLVLAISGALWIIACGVEFGVAYLLITVPLCAWFGIALQADIRANKPIEARQSAIQWPRKAGLKRNLAIFLVAFPLTGVASAAQLTAVITALSSDMLTHMAWLALGMPTLWGLLMVWCCVDPVLKRPFTSIAITGGIAGLTLLL